MTLFGASLNARDPHQFQEGFLPLGLKSSWTFRSDVLTLKGNHPTLYQQVSNWFEQARANEFAEFSSSLYYIELRPDYFRQQSRGVREHFFILSKVQCSRDN